MAREGAEDTEDAEGLDAMPILCMYPWVGGYVDVDEAAAMFVWWYAPEA